MTDTDITALIGELRSGIPPAGETANGEELYDFDAAETTMAAAADALEALQSDTKTIASLLMELNDAKLYLDTLLRSYVGKYCDPIPEWEPLPDLVGMLTQMDNASTVTGEWQARAEKAEAALREKA